MGTNYYYHAKPPCGECGRDHDRIHIGKSSAGWCFSLHVGRDSWDDTPKDFEAWKALLSTPGSIIKDEYGDVVTVEKLMDTITKRSWNSSGEKEPWWYQQNHAEPGPDGLARHSRDSRHCVGHGEGTWDYIVGEFS